MKAIWAEGTNLSLSILVMIQLNVVEPYKILGHV